MICPNCHKKTDEGAAFCGNCGQSLRSAPPASNVPPPPAPPPAPFSPIAQVVGNQPSASVTNQTPGAPFAIAVTNGVAIPGYALAKPGQHAGETKALLALLFGVAGIVGALFMALIGLVLGTTGLVLGTMSRSSPKRGLSTAGLVFSSLAILASMGVWTYAIRHDPRFSQNTPAPSSNAHSITAPAVAASNISTPCYSAGFVNTFNVSNDTDSCDMNAFNGPTFNNSTNVYKVYADTSQTVNAQDYASIFKPAIEKDIRSSLPSFTIDTEKAANFAGSPAYILNASDKTHGVAVVEAAVLHQSGAGENVFILVHATAGQTTDLTTLEAQWQWK